MLTRLRTARRRDAVSRRCRGPARPGAARWCSHRRWSAGGRRADRPPGRADPEAEGSRAQARQCPHRARAQVGQRRRREARQAERAAARCRARGAGGAAPARGGAGPARRERGAARTSSSASRRVARASSRPSAGALAGELRAAYVNGREEQLKLLLNQQDPASVGRMLAYYGYFGRARAERIDSIRDQLEHLALVRERIAAEARRLRGARDAAGTGTGGAARGAGQAHPGRRRRSTGQIKTQGGELKRLAIAGRGLEKLITDLRKALESPPIAKQAPFEPLRGKLPWPVQQGKVLARFGQPRAGGSLRWQGMLIGTERGARVRAPFAGRVAYARLAAGHGPDDRARPRRRLPEPVRPQRRAVPQGRRAVAAGDVIGPWATPGASDQPALYFEVRRGREPVNPETWLQRR